MLYKERNAKAGTITGWKLIRTYLEVICQFKNVLPAHDNGSIQDAEVGDNEGDDVSLVKLSGSQAFDAQKGVKNRLKSNTKYILSLSTPFSNYKKVFLMFKKIL